MSPLPARLADHWWQRPGRRPGRLQYHWHILFHEQDVMHEIAASAQRKLTGLAGLRVPPTEITIRSVSMVAQAQVGHSWQWQPIAEVRLGTG
jgi:hypothetical protein